MSTWKCRDKDVKRLLKDLEHQSWTITQTKKHLKVYCPNGKPRVAVAVSPSDHRTYLNVRRELRNAVRLYEAEAINVYSR